MKTTLASLTSFLLSLAACLLYLNANGQSATEQIKSLEKRRFDAQLTKDTRALNDILADDLVYTHSNGNQDSKKTFVESIASGKQVYQAIEISADTVRLYGSDLAVVTGQMKTTAVVNGNTNDLRLRYTDVYARRNGRWQMVAWQSARLAN